MAQGPRRPGGSTGGSWRDLMGDGQTVFLFCVVYSGALSLIIFANMFARERRQAPMPPQRAKPAPLLRAEQAPMLVPLKKQA